MPVRNYDNIFLLFVEGMFFYRQTQLKEKKKLF